MDDKLITLSEIMKPTHLQKINPIPKNKSMVPFGFGIIPSGKFVQYNKDMIPYRHYIELLRHAIVMNTYYLKDTGEADMVMASMNIKSLEKLTKTEIYSRGNSITAKGKEDSIDKFSKAIKFLANKYFLTISLI